MWNNPLRRVGMLLCAALLFAAAAPAERFRMATAPYVYSFPRDHAAHDAYRTEWWYFTGHLKDAKGRRFGYELTFFRVGLEPRAPHWTAGQSKWYAYQLYPAHFAISDVAGKSFVYHETLARDALGQGFASASALNVRANGWSLTGSAQLRPEMRLQASSGSDTLDLVLQSKKPPAIHGAGGISRKGSCASCASHYYSFTRLATRGTLVKDRTAYSVDGDSWMDHEFGSDELQPDQSGWDWFAIQLRDGRELMLYRLRQRDGTTTPQSSGSWIDANGKVTYVPLRDFAIESTAQWKSPHTGALYPGAWRITGKAVPQSLDIVPLLADQELADPGGTTYWEGDADVRDAKTGVVVGAAYVELTGYASTLRL